MCCKCATVTEAHITTSISVLECPILQTMQPFFILSSCSLVTTFLLPIFLKRWWISEGDNNVEKRISFCKCGINVVEIMTEGDAVPVQVITTSICRMTSLSLTTLKPSMLHRHTDISNYQITEKEGWQWMGGKQMHETHHACKAQMGSISVTHTMAPRAFRAVQQPFPTYTAKDRVREVTRGLQDT